MHVHSGSLVTLHADQARNAEDLEIRPAGSAPGRKRPNQTPKEQIISEILAANEWFVNISKPMEIIREEVEKQFDMYVS